MTIRALSLAGVFFVLCGLLVPAACGKEAVLRAEIVDAQTGRAKASFLTKTEITTPPNPKVFLERRSVRLPRPVGRVEIASQTQFLGFSKTEVWFAINTDATSSKQGQFAGARRTIRARASVRYGQRHLIEDLFSAHGSRLSLVITPSLVFEGAKPPSFWARIFGGLFAR